MSDTILQNIYRFLVKGFPGEQLTMCSLDEKLGIPHDRQYAITNGIENRGSWMPSRSYFINSRCDGMMKHQVRFYGDRVVLTNPEGMEIEFEPYDDESLARANEEIAKFMEPVGVKQDAPPPQIVEIGGDLALWDYTDTPISIINQQSVDAISEAIGVDLDPARFRGNLILNGLEAWEEITWMGKRIQIGDAILDVHRAIDRCPAPGVNPQTGERDVEVTTNLQEIFGHIFCGMYAKVVKGGMITKGDKVIVLGEGEVTLKEAQVDNASPQETWVKPVEVVAYDIGDAATSLTLKPTSSWPLPRAQIGQRIRFHFSSKGWTQHKITYCENDEYQFEIEKTSDNPRDEQLANQLSVGEKLIISGPYGRV